jgi:outer membrane protein assembly factor BamB
MMTTRLRPAAYAALLAAVLAAHQPQPLDAQGSTDWPQWRGPARDGVASSFQPPREWPEQLSKKWSVDVGLGYASPIVIGDRVYMFARRGENEVLSGHDAATGKELWQASYAAPFTMHSAAVPHGQGPKSTPVYVNGVLLSIGMTGVVTALDTRTGKQIWQKPASTPVPLYTTHAFSPIVERDTAIFHLGGHDRGALTALDLRTGTAKWRWTGDGPGYGSPIVADLGGTRQVVTITQGKVVGVDAATGALLWERPFPSQVSTNSTTPILHGQTVIVSGNGGPTVAFTVARSGTQWTTTTVWQNPDIPLRLTNFVLSGDLLFGMTNRNAGQYFGVDANTGKTLWTSPGRQAANVATARAGDSLLSLENDGDLVVARSSQSGFEPIRKYKVADTETWAEAAFSGNRIFVKDNSQLSLWTVN